MKLSRLARLVALDEKLLRRLVKSRRVRTMYALRVLCRLVDPDMVVMSIAVAIFWPPLVPVAERVALSLGVCSTLVVIVKRSVKRTRPAADIQAHVPPDRFSFPSGHTAAGFALAVGMLGAMPQVVPALLLIACIIGYARMYLGVHYPLDVAAGAAVGMVSGGIVAAIDLPTRIVWQLPF